MTSEERIPNSDNEAASLPKDLGDDIEDISLDVEKAGSEDDLKKADNRLHIYKSYALTDEQERALKRVIDKCERKKSEFRRGNTALNASEISFVAIVIGGTWILVKLFSFF